MSDDNKKPAPALDSFHKCCGQCPEAKKAAAEGTKPAPHTPCHLRDKDQPKPSA
jgi:hypothetical protein